MELYQLSYVRNAQEITKRGARVQAESCARDEKVAAGGIPQCFRGFLGAPGAASACLGVGKVRRNGANVWLEWGRMVDRMAGMGRPEWEVGEEPLGAALVRRWNRRRVRGMGR